MSILLSKNASVRMFDGSTKTVNELKRGDKLLGSNSKSIAIKAISKKEGLTFVVKQKYGDEYRVGRDHILNLRLSKSPRIQTDDNHKRHTVTYFNKDGCLSKTFYWKGNKSGALKSANNFLAELPKKNTEVQITVDDYFDRTKSWQNAFKGFKKGVDYPTKKVKLDPYILGVWLGDGTTTGPQITTPDPIIMDKFKTFFPKMKIKVKKDNLSYSVSSGIRGGTNKGKNRFLNLLRHYNLISNKHIPEDFLNNSRKVRLELLAGLLDTDGHLINNCFQIIQKVKRLSEEIATLARSLGFRATLVEKRKSWTYKGVKKWGTYHDVHISGDTNLIPTKVKRKKATPRRQIKEPLSTGVSITKKTRGKLYSISLPQNKSLLLEDFTVVG